MDAEGKETNARTLGTLLSIAQKDKDDKAAWRAGLQRSEWGLRADREIKRFSKRKYGRREKYALIKLPVRQARCR